MTTTTSPRYISATDTAKLMRKALKAAFPGQRFSVRTDLYAGGASINVQWTDGAPRCSVEKVAQRFAGATFDGMTDCKNHHASELDGERVHYGADFVFCRRDHSPELLTEVAGQVAARLGVPAPEIRTHDDGSAYTVGAPAVWIEGHRAWLSGLVETAANDYPENPHNLL